MREQVGTWVACLVLVALVAMAAKGEEPTPDDFESGRCHWIGPDGARIDHDPRPMGIDGGWSCRRLVDGDAAKGPDEALYVPAHGEDLKLVNLITSHPPAPAWHQMPLAEPGTYQSRLSLVDPISIELRRGGSEYRITNEPAAVGRVEIRERFGELIGVRVGKGCRVEVVDHDRKAER